MFAMGNNTMFEKTSRIPCVICTYCAQIIQQTQGFYSKWINVIYEKLFIIYILIENDFQEN